MSEWDVDPSSLPLSEETLRSLSLLDQELRDGEITQKGFQKKRSQLLFSHLAKKTRRADSMTPTTPNLKNSFSLSSLPPSNPCVDTPEQVRIRERPYNSLTKKPRRNEEKENWRKSWDSTSERIGDGFQENYNYLMNTQLIDSCRSITNDGKMCNNTSQLFQLSTEIADNSFNCSLLESQKRNKQYLTNSMDDNIEHEIKGLILCLECIETKLPPLNPTAHQELAKEDLATRKLKHTAIHEELEALGRRIRSKKKSSLTKIQNLSYKSLRSVEDRWSQLYLRSIEWEVCIEQLLGSHKRLKLLNNSREHNTSSETNDEPASKYRRLSLLTYSSDKNEQSTASLESSEHILMDTSVPPEDLRPPSRGILLSNSSQTSSLSQTNSFSRMVDLSSLASDSDNNNSDVKSNRCSIDLSQFSLDENLFAKDASIFNNSDRSARNHAIIYHKHEDTVSEASGVKSSEISSDDETSWAYNSTSPSTRTSTLTRKEDGCASVQNHANGSYDAGQDSHDSSAHATYQINETYDNATFKMPSKRSCQEPACGQTFNVSNSCSKYPETSSPNLGDSPKTKSIRKLVNYAELLVKRAPRAKRYHHSSHSQEDKLPQDSCDASGEYTTEDDETCDTYYSSEDNTRRCDDLSTPKITFRSKSLRVDRPRSMSILSHSHMLPQLLANTYSNSESALHNLSLSQSVRTESSLNSSSTIEESSHCDRSQESSTHCDRSASSSLKRTRKKHRRLRRSGLGSADNLSGKCARQPTNRTYVLPQELYKSESFSGSFTRRLSFSGDKTALSSDVRTLNNTTDAEMDELEEEATDTLGEEKKKIKKKCQPVVPNFQIGKAISAFPAAKLRTDFTSGAEEQTSSFGTIPDEAWDNYQEKYHSEAYSEELPDSELLNQTLHFGEDYGSFINVHSDLDSSVVDSESEEDVDKFITKCKVKYHWCEAVNLSLLNKSKLRRTCRDIIRKLRIISEKLDDVAEIKELTQKYEEFESKLSGEESLTLNLKRELELLRREFNTLECRVTDIEDKKELNEKIREIQEKKDKLTRVRNIQDETFFTPQETEHLYNKLEERHKYFTKIATTWERLEGDLIHFQTDLQQEVEKLKQEMGKSAEFIHGLIKQELSIIQDPELFQQEVSRVLTEKCATDIKQGCNLYQMAMPSYEGSDSGISDTEHDCERDRKLSDLKQLQKDLETVLSSNKKTLIAKKMEETEAELRKLKNLRRLVFHSTMLPQSCIEAAETEDTAQLSETGNSAPWTICRDSKNRIKILTAVVAPEAAGADVSVSTDSPDKPERPYKGNSHLWRIIKSALPFHLAIIMIACVVWLLEPNCCDHLNNLNLSNTPHLKYTAGPPPI